MSEIKISGSIRNLKVLLDALALPRSNKSTGKGDNLIFPYRKIVVNQKFGGLLTARQSMGSVYSQVICRSDVETLFLKIEGEGDVMFDMAKMLSRHRELATFETAEIRFDTETKRILFIGTRGNEREEWGTYEPSHEIDDARGIVRDKCECQDPKTCPKCNGSGMITIPLSFKNKFMHVPVGMSPYDDVGVGVQFDIDSGVMRTVGDKTETLLNNIYPMQFNNNHLLVFVGDENDISSDNFKKEIPLTYTINNMVGKVIKLGTDFRNVFGSLDGNITIQSADVPEDHQSIYVTKNEPGFHCGIKMETKQKVV